MDFWNAKKKFGTDEPEITGKIGMGKSNNAGYQLKGFCSLIIPTLSYLKADSQTLRDFYLDKLMVKLEAEDKEIQSKMLIDYGIGKSYSGQM